MEGKWGEEMVKGLCWVCVGIVVGGLGVIWIVV